MPDTPQATEVREQLDRLHEQEKEYYPDDFADTFEEYMQLVVEDGEFLPSDRITVGIDVPLKARLTGEVTENVTSLVAVGMLLGAALERDIPKDSELEDLWRDGEFELPE